MKKTETGGAMSRVVYTALIGDYEVLQEQPVAHESDVTFICFTDNDRLVSDTWQIQLVEPTFPADPIRSARSLKIIGHPMLDEYGELLWVDNRVILRQDPQVILKEMLSNADIGFIRHSFRDCVADEFDAVIDDGCDDPVRVNEQRQHYATFMNAVFDEKPIWTGMFARRWNESTKKMMRLWMDEVLRYSKRDQLSINRVIRQGHLDVEIFEKNNRSSNWHSWPRVTKELGRRPMNFSHSIWVPGHIELSNLSAQLNEINEIYEIEVMRTHEHARLMQRQLNESQRKAADLIADLENIEATHAQMVKDLTQVKKELGKIKKSRTYRFARFLQEMKNKVMQRKLL